MHTLLRPLFFSALLAPSAALATDRAIFAGQHLPAGTLSVCDDGSALSVTYDSTGTGWAFTTTHLYVGTRAPTKAAPGQFPYKHTGIFTDVDRYDIPLSSLGATAGTSLVLAAHAEAVGADYTEPSLVLDTDIPETVTMSVLAQGAGAYWTLEVSDGGALDGVYDGYCVDTDRTLGTGATYPAAVVSSYEDLAGLVEYPENFDQVNWILNQDFIGQPAAAGGTFTYGDVQRAIWTLIEDNVSSAGLGAWSQDRVDELLDLAAEGGLGYTPGCFDSLAVLLVPLAGADITAQVVIGQVVTIEVDLECALVPTTGAETAWASGTTRFRTGWGSHFSYTVGSATCE